MVGQTTLVLNDSRVRVARGLRLPRQNLARGILGYGFKHLAGKEHDGRFDNRKQQREENRRDQREFDGSRTPAIASESAKDVWRRLLKQRATASRKPPHGSDYRASEK